MSYPRKLGPAANRAIEAQAFVAWRDAVWQAAIAMLADAEASGEPPGVEDVIAALPVWTE